MHDDANDNDDFCRKAAQQGFLAGASSALGSVVGDRFAVAPHIRRTYGSLQQDGWSIAKDGQRLFAIDYRVGD